MAGSKKRISKELAEVTSEPPVDVEVQLVDEADLYKWDITMKGPEDSVYAGARFKLLLVLPTDYPFRPPSLNFKTKIYHPNVTNDDKGAMCLGILRLDQWKPSCRITGVLQTARDLLLEPNPDDAIETSIAEQYKSNKKDFTKTAKDWVKMYASK